MGTNYYLLGKVCEHCGRSDPPRHIGKSSVGWVFSLRIYPEEGIYDLEDWQKLWAEPTAKIKDEYGQPVTSEEMLAQITERRGKATQEEWAKHAGSDGVLAPEYGLLRHRIGPHCFRHGKGTWDLILEEFS